MKGSQLSKLVLKAIREEYHGYAVNLVVAGTSGNPDILACIRGKFWAFEIKGEGDTASMLQRAQLARITAAGGKGGIVRSMDDLHNMLDASRRKK